MTTSFNLNLDLYLRLTFIISFDGADAKKFSKTKITYKTLKDEVKQNLHKAFSCPSSTYILGISSANLVTTNFEC